jgi:hypothetical protein
MEAACPCQVRIAWLVPLGFGVVEGSKFSRHKWDRSGNYEVNAQRSLQRERLKPSSFLV